MGLFDFMNNAKPTATPAPAGSPAPAPQPTASGNQQLPNDPATKAIEDGKIPGTDQLPANPLDSYTKLWDTTNNTPEAPPKFSLDPTVLKDVSSKMDFTRDLDPELLQKATSGDMNAMLQVINQSNQRAYQAALAHGSSLTEKYVGARSEYDLKGVNSKVKSELTASHLTDIPNAGHPAVKNELIRISQAMQKENPDASPQQIAEAAKAYFKNIFSAMNPEPTKEQQRTASGETDWESFFSSNPDK